METFSIVPLSLSWSTAQRDVNIVKVERTLAYYRQKNASYEFTMRFYRSSDFFREDEYDRAIVQVRHLSDFETRR